MDYATTFYSKPKIPELFKLVFQHHRYILINDFQIYHPTFSPQLKNFSKINTIIKHCQYP